MQAHGEGAVQAQVVNWAPQNDVLGHPKVKVFLSHCGANSMYEVREPSPDNSAHQSSSKRSEPGTLRIEYDAEDC